MKMSLAALLVAAFASVAAAQSAGQATGTVYEDRNQNGQRDAGEPGLRGILVSNGREFTRTDRAGVWRLPVGDDNVLFAVKPTDFAYRLDANRKPTGFFYVHRPAGTAALRYGGLPATGPLPNRIDFGFVRKKEPRQFRVAFFGDTQPYNLDQVQFTAQDAIAEVAGRNDLAFGVSLGDVVGDNLSLLPPLMQAKSTMGVPWHYVVGNHDIDFDVPDDKDSTASWRRLVGPPYYAFEYGNVWFIVLENVDYRGQGKGYGSGLNEVQFTWLRNLLQEIPRDRMTVIMQHIPIIELKERAQFFALLSDRPNTFSIAAHWHVNRHIFFGKEEGWTGAKPHHHLVAATVCGSWWSGELDEVGIPHSMMRDGGPRGYILGNFNARGYDLQFKATRRPADYQINIDAPHRIKSNERLNVTANFFFGTQFCRLEMRLNDGAWQAMRALPPGKDPFYQRLKDLETSKKIPATGRALPGLYDNFHMWQGSVAAGLPEGGHRLEVRATDMFGRTHSARRVLWVDPS